MQPPVVTTSGQFEMLMLLGTMPVYEIAALAAALCWALNALFSAGPAGHLGAFAFNRIRQIFVTCLLAGFVLYSGSWHSLTSEALLPLILSGIIGIFIGDTALFLCLTRIGPRRTGILFAANAPMTVLLGWLFLDETISMLALLGVALVAVGVCLAILFGRRKTMDHPWEQVKGSLWVGIGLGLLAALSQAVGAIITRPVMEAGFDPVLGSMIRVATAACCLTVLTLMPIAVVKPRKPLNLPILLQTLWTGFLGIALGMTLLLYALSGGQAGIVTTLSATTPVMVLPLLWLRTGQRPAWGAWAGAVLVVCGMALIFTH